MFLFKGFVIIINRDKRFLIAWAGHVNLADEFNELRGEISNLCAGLNG